MTITVLSGTWNEIHNGTDYGSIMQDANGVEYLNWETGAYSIIANPGSIWQAQATGDFNGDGVKDVVLRNSSTGQLTIWDLSAGHAIIGGGAIATNPGLGWNVVGTGDFNSDGKSDLLLQSSTGALSEWDMNANAIIGGGPIATNPGTLARVAGVIPDETNPGRTEIYFQNTSIGQVSVWDMSGQTIVTGGTVGPATGNARLDGVSPNPTPGGYDNLFFQNPTGDVSQWWVQGTTVKNSMPLGHSDYALLGSGGAGGGTTYISELPSGFAQPAGELYLGSPTGTVKIDGGAAGARFIGMGS